MQASRGIFLAAMWVALFAPWAVHEARALTEGKTVQGDPYVTGGVALGERDALDKRRQAYSLWVATAAKKTGAYLADVRVKITDEAGKTVLDTRLDGPWLLVKLKPGRYKVDASFGKQTLQKATTIHAADHHDILFYFDVELETRPKAERN